MSRLVRRSNVLPVEADSRRASSCPFGEKIIASSADGPNLALIMTKMESLRPLAQNVYMCSKRKLQNIHLNKIPPGCVASFHVAFLVIRCRPNTLLILFIVDVMRMTMASAHSLLSTHFAFNNN